MLNLPARVAVEDRYVNDGDVCGWIGVFPDGQRCFLHPSSPLSPGPTRGSDATVVWSTVGKIDVGGEVLVNVHHWQLYSAFESLEEATLPGVFRNSEELAAVTS